MKEHLHLFTPVIQELPKRFGGYFVITATGFATKTMYLYGHWSIHTAIEGLIPERPYDKVTHWLDLSKLTTKKEAMQQYYKDGYDQGFNDGNHNANIKE